MRSSWSISRGTKRQNTCALQRGRSGEIQARLRLRRRLELQHLSDRKGASVKQLTSEAIVHSHMAEPSSMYTRVAYVLPLLKLKSLMPTSIHCRKSMLGQSRNQGVSEKGVIKRMHTSSSTRTSALNVACLHQRKCRYEQLMLSSNDPGIDAKK